MHMIELLEKISYKYNYEILTKVWECYGLPTKIVKRKEKCQKRLQQQQKKFNQDLMTQQGDLALEIKNIQMDLDYFTNLGDITQYDKNYQNFAQIGERITQAQSDSEVVNRREKILEYKETDYMEIGKIKNQWQPYNKLWELSMYVQQIIPQQLKKQLNSIDREEFTNQIMDSYSELVKLEKTVFKNINHIYEVTVATREMYATYRPYLSLINDLLNPHMKNRKVQWKQISKILDIEINGDLNFTFEFLLSKGIMEVKDQIRDISEIATKEVSFEKIILKMKQEWKLMKFEMVQFRDTDTYILKDLDPILDKLDEDITKVISIASSPYVKMMENEINQWKNTLQRAQDIIELWIKVQKQWQYLQPIFYSEDIIRQMPTEGKKYESVNKIWNLIMNATYQTPTVLDACAYNKLKEQFEQAIETLDQVQKGLNEYLESKRTAFARFYFLSNEELLSILAQTRDPEAVQPHLQKCFEGIERLLFTDNTSKITKMYSNMGEEVELNKKITILDNDNEQRGVEDWLKDVENIMKSTIQQIFNNAINQYSANKRVQWLFNFPAQIAVTSERVIWTNNVEESLKKKTIKNYYKQLDEELLEIVKMVREKQEIIRRQTLGTLIVLEVHALEVVKSLIEKNLENVNGFEWLAQMRYYLQNEEMTIQMVNTSRVYGYEYLGNQDRLVITPLTDRCYRTLMSALQMNLGGSPEGPAGTGKTETVKDLSKSLAKHCQVFNCQDELDVGLMAKFFKGLVICGSWSCFDEFNRIELEVLSVIAQQVLSIQNAIYRESQKPKKKSAQKPHFTFEGTSIPLDNSCAIFTTMNPGYQGRSELPDNLKALFRPVAMMIPNYRLIAQISLYSYGYQNAPDLSLKIQQALKLASEQVSTQKHYDFGMRAVKSIIICAGNLKREHIDEDESELVLKAIIDINVPKFTNKDVPLFMDILSDLFPNVKNQIIFDDNLMQEIKKYSNESHLILNDYLTQKIEELYQMFLIRHGLMIVGNTLSAKSTIIKIIQNAITNLNQKNAHFQYLENKHNQQVKLITLKQRLETITKSQNKLLNLNNRVSSFEEFSQNQQNLSQIQEMDILIKEIDEIEVQLEKENVNLQYQKVKIQQMNPKAITLKNLYGFNDELSNEFKEGVAARIFRNFADDFSQNKNWILFDGPVDALWIENLNTVLDDNKKLCLPNGETVRLTNNMSILFEVQDLLEASPATVSRCGMVFMESNGISYESLLINWIHTLPNSLQAIVNQYYVLLMNLFISNIISLLFNSSDHSNKKQFFSLDNINYQWLIISFFKVLETQLLNGKTKKIILQEEEFQKEKQLLQEQQMRFVSQGSTQNITQQIKKPEINKKENKQQEEKNYKVALGDIIFSILWSFGIIIEENHRKEFQILYREEVNQLIEKFDQISDKSKLIMSEENDLFDVYWEREKQVWQIFMRGNQVLEQGIQFNDIYINTNESLRTEWIIERLLDNGNNILLYGRTGTGKTQQIRRYLEKKRDKVISTRTSFTATTSCDEALMIFESKIEKQKRGKGIYGPLQDFKNVIFIDDLNMPQKRKEDYGSQPSIELIRQWMNQQGWYDIKTLEFKQIVDIQFATAMGLGRPQLTNRLLRYFNTIFYQSISVNTLYHIVSQILDWGFYNHIDSVKLQINTYSKCIIDSFIQIQNTFLPLPSKTHYLFNLRDVLKIVQGIIKISPNQYSAMTDTKQNLINILIFESSRVYADRLIDHLDYITFLNIMSQQIQLNYNYQLDMNAQSQIQFGNFMNDDKEYRRLNEEQIKDKINKYIEDYNDINKKKIEIVLFQDAQLLLCKISRIISQIYGNGLLIGIGGMGRKTMTKLATFIQEYQLFNLEDKEVNSIVEWQEQCREVIKQTGVLNNQLVFLINDSDIKYEKMLEDINSILNTGEIPQLFQGEDKEIILQELKELVQKEGKKNQALDQQSLYELLIENTKRNLHIVLCLSPIGDSIRTRFKNYPSLISCTNMIWTQPWSEAALFEVATHFLSQSGLTQSLQEISSVCVQFHVAVRNQIINYLKYEQKYYYVTPISYQNLLNNFQKTYSRKMNYLVNTRNTYVQGVQKLQDCNQLVQEMKQTQELLKPILEEKSKKTEEIMKIIEVETEEAEKQKEIVSKDEEITEEKAQAAENIANQCKEKLAIAEPELLDAIKALKGLKVDHFVELKNLQKPVQAIKNTLIAIFILVDPKIAKGLPNGKEEEYLAKAKKKLDNPKQFKEYLQAFEKDNISDKTIKKIEQFLEKNPDYNKESVGNASIAAAGLCKWLFAILNYNKVYLSILPLRQDLEKANKLFQDATDELTKKRQILQDIEQKIKQLNEGFEKENFEKQKFLAEIENCEKKMNRALKLTTGLADERQSWIVSGEEMKTQIENGLGDILISVGFISYLGAFTDKYRSIIINENWIKSIEQEKIPVNPEFSLEKTIGDEIEIQNWIVHNLPNNEVSIQNAIIMKESEQYPLIIDPQNQVYKYLQKIHSNGDFQSCKTGKEMFKYLEMCIRTGKCLVIQGVGEQLDSMLDNVLNKNIDRKGTLCSIQLGTNNIEYDDKFNLFLITKNPNPHYTPETLNKVTLINFTITQEGLKDQLLSIISKEEEPKDEEEKIKILIENSENNIKKKEIEAKILKMIQETEGSKMLDSDVLITQLTSSKQVSLEIQSKLQISKAAEKRINLNRQNYDKIAKIGSYMYFMILQLIKIDPMYDFSLEFFIKVYKKAINKAEKPIHKNIKQRVDNIQESLKRQIYYEICRSIFVKHKLVFSFMMGITNLQIENLLSQIEFKILITGIGEIILEQDSSVLPTFISNKGWDLIRHLSSNVTVFNNLDNSILNPNIDWATYIDTLHANLKLNIDQEYINYFYQQQQQIIIQQQQNQQQQIQQDQNIQEEQTNQLGKKKQTFNKGVNHQIIEQEQKQLLIYQNNCPDQRFSRLSELQNLLLVKALRPDLFIEKLKIVIENELGEYFIQNEIISLEDSYKESVCGTPLMFVLQSGDDPQEEIKKFASDKGKQLMPISLGKGQGKIAKKNIMDCSQAGNWVLLQNCHLAKTWLFELEEIVEQMADLNEKKTHPDFRLFLTTSSTDAFPRFLLQESIKMTKDPPKGIKSNVLQLYNNINSSKQEKLFFESCQKQEEWQKLFMGLCFFHSILRERRRFGPIGWNVYYEFNEADLKISMKQLYQMLNEYEQIPFEALNYLTGECYYGGRVTDDWDRKLLVVLLEQFYNQEFMYITDYRFCAVQEYYIPDNMNLDNSINFIQSLNNLNNPELFGLHSNASYQATIFETNLILDNILNSYPKQTDKSSDPNAVTKSINSEILSLLPSDFHYPTIQLQFPILYNKSMNTVLIQEILRYNNLLSVIRNTINNLNLALEGKLLLSIDLEIMIDQFNKNQIPQIWIKHCYSTNKPLMNFIRDLIKRTLFYQDWIANEQPNVYWMPGFFFPQSFLTGVLQTHSRSFKLPIDILKFNFQVINQEINQILNPPQIGCYIHGLYIDGAMWSNHSNSIVDQEKNIIYQKMPIIWLIPVDDENAIIKNDEKNKNYVYDCPLYQTLLRKGELLTTGNSTNFILTVKLKASEKWQHWTKRGVALLTQLDD